MILKLKNGKYFTKNEAINSILSLSATYTNSEKVERSPKFFSQRDLQGYWAEYWKN